jgi:hypothetical protein
LILSPPGRKPNRTACKTTPHAPAPGVAFSSFKAPVEGAITSLSQPEAAGGSKLEQMQQFAGRRRNSEWCVRRVERQFNSPTNSQM